MGSPTKHLAGAGFTLVELLIVVVILAILAAIAIPLLGRSGLEAREAALRTDLSVVRSALERYQIQHLGKYPGYPAGGGAPTQVELRKQLILGTKADGSTGGPGNPAYPLGPYLAHVIPANAISGLAAVAIVPDGVAFPAPDDSTGYLYKPQTGEFRANLTGSSTSGEPYIDF